MAPQNADRLEERSVFCATTVEADEYYSVDSPEWKCRLSNTQAGQPATQIAGG